MIDIIIAMYSDIYLALWKNAYTYYRNEQNNGHNIPRVVVVWTLIGPKSFFSDISHVSIIPLFTWSDAISILLTHIGLGFSHGIVVVILYVL